MLSIDPSERTERENYKLLTGTIIPRPIAFVTSMNANGIVNGAPFSYFNIVSSNPPMISLSIQRKNGNRKDTANNIINNKTFVVHIVDEENVKAINKTAASLPAHQSEIDLSSLSLVPSKTITVPGIDEAKVRLECRLEHVIELGGNDEHVSADFLIGKVTQYHLAQDITYEDHKIDPSKLRAVSRLAGSHYAKTGEIFSIERPK